MRIARVGLCYNWMLQLDEDQLQVYSCRFTLHLLHARIPLHPAELIFEWRLANARNAVHTPPQSTLPNSVLPLSHTLNLSAQMLRHPNTLLFHPRSSQLSVYLVSSSRSEQRKLVGSLQLSLADILNSNPLASPIWLPLTHCSLDATVQLTVTANSPTPSSLLSVNLDLSLLGAESVWVRKGELSGESAFHKKETVCEAGGHPETTRQESNPRYGNSQLQEEKSEGKEHCKSISYDSPISTVHRASFLSEPTLKRWDEPYNRIAGELYSLDARDAHFLVSQNQHLKKLLFQTRRERKMEEARHGEDLRGLAAELSQREAESMKAREGREIVDRTLGELMDECAVLKASNDMLKEQVELQRKTTSELKQSYELLQSRVSAYREWETEKTNLQTQLMQTSTALSILQQNIQQMSYSNSQISRQAGERQKQLTSSLEETTAELVRKEQIIALYQERFNKLQEEINCIQDQENGREEQQFQHRSHYYSLHQTRDIRIEEEGSLRQIHEEEHEDSLLSPDNSRVEQRPKDEKRQIDTCTSLSQSAQSAAHTCPQLELLRILTMNLQKEHNHFKQMYQQLEMAYQQAGEVRRSLSLDLQQLKYEFICELSRVTALVNEKILENRTLKEEVIQLQRLVRQEPTPALPLTSPFVNATPQTTRSPLQMQLKAALEERDQLSEKCHRLKEENTLLIQLNQQKEELCQQGSCIYDLEVDGKAAVEKFETSLQFLLQNRDKYRNILNKYGLQDPKREDTLKQHQRQQRNLSDIIHNFGYNEHPSPSEMQSDQRSQSNLLIESTARVNQSWPQPIPLWAQPTPSPLPILAKLVAELSLLAEERERGAWRWGEMLGEEGAPSGEWAGQLRALLASLRREVVSGVQGEMRLLLLSGLRDLENHLATSIYS